MSDQKGVRLRTMFVGSAPQQMESHIQMNVPLGEHVWRVSVRATHWKNAELFPR